MPGTGSKRDLASAQLAFYSGARGVLKVLAHLIEQGNYGDMAGGSRSFGRGGRAGDVIEATDYVSRTSCSVRGQLVSRILGRLRRRAISVEIVATKPIVTVSAQVNANNVRPTAKAVAARVTARAIARMTLSQKITG